MLRMTVCAGLGAVLAVSQPLGRMSAEPRPTDTQVKAIYLYNFAKFVTWPAKEAKAGAETPLTICVFHATDFAPVLKEAVAGETVGGRSIDVKSIDEAKDAARCSILYIDSSASARMETVLQSVAGRSVLTVSDISGFAERGGMIEFVMEGSRVRFKVGLAAAQKANLILSSQLLKVAQSVTGGPAMEARP